jgi:hypothetical protein
VWQCRYSPKSPAARIQLVTVRRPRARIAPTNSHASRGPGRGSRTDARAENQWHGGGVGCGDGVAASVRGGGLVWLPPSSRSGRPSSSSAGGPERSRVVAVINWARRLAVSPRMTAGRTKRNLPSLKQQTTLRNGHFGLARSCPVAILTLFPGGGEMAHRAIGVALLLASLPIAGCGTVENLARPGPEGGGKSPFGGVRQDVWCIREAANGDFGFRAHPKSESEQYPQVALMLFCAADLPLSLIGDVVTWPYTVAYSFINQPIPTPPVTQALTPPVTQAPAEVRPQTSPLELLPMPRPLP